jgi:isopenicillin-N N-acyltransferase like protein
MKTVIKILIIILFPLIFISCETKSADSDNVILDTTHTNLPILHLNGTAFENGVQHGKLLRKEINELIGLWKQDLEAKYQMPADTFIKVFLDSTNYISSIKKWTPELLDEVKGISKGSGIDFNTLFAFQLVDEIWTNARLIKMPHHCTSIAANNFLRDGGINFNAQTIDIPSFYHDYPVLLDIKDKNSASSKLVMTFAGYIGINGLNKNISVTENSLTALKSALNGLPVAFVSRGILERKTFDDAVSFIKTIKHASGQNYIIASRTNIISLECATDLITEYWPDSIKHYTFHGNNPLTNNSYHPFYNNYLKNLYGAIPEAISISDRKAETVNRQLAKNKTINAETIKSILSKEPVCNQNTFALTIMELNKKYNRLYISLNKSDSTKYVEFKLKK